MTTRPKPSARNGFRPENGYYPESGQYANYEMTTPTYQVPGQNDGLPSHRPQYNHNGHKVTKRIHPDGESGRRGIHPWHFPRICFRSTSRLSLAANVLWPFVPAAIVLHFVAPKLHLWIFIINYIAMVPAANLIGFAGQELARKLPKVLGVITEVTLGSIVEIILFITLVSKGARATHHGQGAHGTNYIVVVQAAILGSILANLLFCLGCCFIAGGLRKKEQKFHEAVSEVGSGLLLVAAMGLVIPAAFSAGGNPAGLTAEDIERRVLNISRATAIVLLVAFAVYVYFNLRTHHNIYEDLLEEDEKADADRHKDLRKDKLTLTEAILALLIAIACVALLAVFLVEQIEFTVCHHGISDAFMGLILVPLVEKVSEHLSAVDEAYDNQMNFALSHVLGASVQTALFNGPLAVIVAWGLNYNLGLNFGIFDSIVLVLAVIVVGNFLRDGKSNYLEGVLCVFVYLLIAVSAYFLPNPTSCPAEGAE